METTPNFGILFWEMLNGGAPVDERTEIGEWAAYICKPKEAEE